jgi:hypothetical protein
MRCSFLKGNYMIFCTAVREGYIPSLFELNEYCRRDKYRMCPLFGIAEGNEKPDIAPPEGNDQMRAEVRHPITPL